MKNHINVKLVNFIISFSFCKLIWNITLLNTRTLFDHFFIFHIFQKASNMNAEALYYLAITPCFLALVLKSFSEDTALYTSTPTHRIAAIVIIPRLLLKESLYYHININIIQ